MILQLLRANQNFVWHCVQQIAQLFLLLLNIDFRQEYFGLLLLLHVKDYLEHQEAKNSGKNTHCDVKVFSLLCPLVYQKGIHEDLNETSSNEVQEKV